MSLGSLAGVSAVAAALGIGRRRLAGSLVQLLDAHDRAGAADRPVLVWGEELGLAVSQTGLSVAVAAARRRRKRGPEPILTRPEALPFADGVYDAAFADGLPLAGADAPELLAELCRVVRGGGVVAVVDRTSRAIGRAPGPARLAALLLHAGVADLEQRVVGAWRYTAGRVRRVERAASSGSSAAGSAS